MDIRLDDPGDLARNNIRFQPVVLRSLLGAGYHGLGDLRWVPSRELMNLHYVGFKLAAQIRAVVRRFEGDAPVATPCGTIGGRRRRGSAVYSGNLRLQNRPRRARC
jgi:hypothetical protein